MCKFHYLDQVVVTKGFYKNWVGKVKEYIKLDLLKKVKYSITFANKDTFQVDEDDLKFFKDD